MRRLLNHRRKREIILSVLVLGKNGVGKNTLLPSSPDIEPYEYAIGFAASVLKMDYDDQKVSLVMLTPKADLFELQDTNLGPPYTTSSGLVLVFDVTDQSSYECVKELRRVILETTGPIPGLVVANKTDLEDARMVSVDELNLFCVENGLDFVETGLDDRVKFRNALNDFGRKIVERYLN